MDESRKFTKKEKGWIMYDWANSVYATNIMAAIFPTIFVSIAGGAGSAGDQWWGYATSIATFIVAILAPILGAVADYKGMKKKLFTGFMLLGVVTTALLALDVSWQMILVFYVLSRIGFSGSCLFYDSFLTDVTTDERMDRVSSWGYAMGYIGGSTIPFVFSIALLVILGYGSPVAQKFSILITSVWWLAFTVPFLKNVHQEHYIETSEKRTLGQIFRNIGKTAAEIFKNKALFIFVVAYFFYIDGVGTIISISTAYGTILGLGTVGMIVALLVTQIVAMPCSILFSKLSGKIGTRKALSGAILVYLLICIVGFYMGFSLEPKQDAYNTAVAQTFAAYTEEDQTALVDKCSAAFIAKDAQGALEQVKEDYANTEITDKELIFAASEQFLVENVQASEDYKQAISFSTILFWAMAILVGTVQGGIQAVSRSFFGKLVPKDRSNEYFGFFDIFGKFASVLGPLLYSLTAGITGRSSYGVLCLAVLFLVGFTLLRVGRGYFEKIDKV